MRFKIFQESAIGARALNQDRMGYSFTRDSLLMIVADGMGGHPRGEVAAQIALQAAGAAFKEAARPRLADPEGFLVAAFLAGHRDILRYQEQHGLPDAPRTTLVACVVQQGRAWWAHAGDSRAYWIRQGAPKARTRDHSRVEQLIEMGVISPKDVEQHPQRHLVTNCLGAPFDPRVQLGGGVDLQPGDTLLLCSDGVWSALPDAEICGRTERAPVSTSVPELVRDAVIAAGSTADNATALAMTWEGEQSLLDDWQALLGAEHLLATTIVQPEEGGMLPDLTEDDIERTIREIREAIERNGGR